MNVSKERQRLARIHPAPNPLPEGTTVFHFTTNQGAIMTTDNLSTNGTTLPTPEEMLALYMAEVRINGTIAAVATADRPEIREEVLELWENTHEPFQEADYDLVYPIAMVAAQASILICQLETRG